MTKFLKNKVFTLKSSQFIRTILDIATRHQPDIAILDVIFHEGPEGQKEDPSTQQNGPH